ncbi:molybdopterin-dependent oxidoreductase [Mycolicibacterium sp. YH-1]|jgi:formate dehydrogenase|uniref:molybdopterin-containing oxidoreductase family protein n=1 Tax=Mycolicibacterium sp. YH-1 TaxID=2908837 RepID=UPI001F4C1C0C|nr:molybdopterin-dependent oxidoreductase [Mycolicibacterium sp. YH-1]UNB52136.1 molybdopterin-dependent oxidoreductase [Mycolicibacterium sp. YH-1]
MKTVYTSCRICTSNCGTKVTVDDNRVTHIGPDKENPYTWRDFCRKGQTADESLHHPLRLTSPMRRDGDRYVEATWDEAITDIAQRMRAIRDQYGPQAIGMYIGNPAYYASANGFFSTALLDGIGTHNRFSAISLDTNSFHRVNHEMYGTPALGLMPDVDDCKCFLLIGMNPAASGVGWGWTVPNGWRRILAAKDKGADLIVVDPQRTASADKATTHLAVRPRGDWALLLGLLKVIFDNRWEDQEACALLKDLDVVQDLAADADLEDLALRCGIKSDVITDVARRFALAETAFCEAHTGVSQHPTGTVGEWLSHVLNFVTGRVDKPGGKRFERGYVDTIALWELLAPAQEQVSRVRGLPATAGYLPAAELTNEITVPGDGQIRALIINAGNPVVSAPGGNQLDSALASLDLLVAVDIMQRESHRHAHWLIPDTHFLEREDLFVLISQFQDMPFLQFAQRAVEPHPNVREAWRFFTDLALAMKVPMFGKRGFNSVIKASRLLAKLTGRPLLEFNPRWLFRALVISGRRLKWKDILAHEHGWLYGEKEFGNFVKRALRNPDRLVHAAPPAFVAEARRLLAIPPADNAPDTFTLVGLRHSHTMNTWLSDLPGIRTKKKYNEAAIHPADAHRLGVSTGDIVRITSPVGSIELPACVTDGVRCGVVVVEQGWGSRVFDPRGTAEPVSFGVNRNVLVDTEELDPLSQMPALNSQAVTIERVESAQGAVGGNEDEA